MATISHEILTAYLCFLEQLKLRISGTRKASKVLAFYGLKSPPYKLVSHSPFTEISILLHDFSLE